MLKTWLEVSKRPSGTFRFNVVNINEKNSRDLENINEIFSKIIINESVGYDTAKKLAKKYGWNKILESIITPRLTRTSNMKKGKFGEMLESSVLETFFDYVIPIKKWRYAISSDQSLPRCDIIAVKLEGQKIIEMSFIESKLTTTSDSNKIIEAHSQLMEEKKSGFSDILSFIILRLIDEKHPLQEAFIEYTLIKDKPNDSYRIAATYDNAKWNENYLTKLNDIHTKSTPELTVDLIRIEELEKVVKTVYEKKGWKPIE
ncbi:Hachiman antiphage defense system protein HamA [Candidatus Nitrosarchaeum limnium]|uniref:Anti-bacteriophage protein A/HamA C-terminal domain-containing protein n=1 Tax=Candidatus Nitrosarchaeum limnium BG20 TaxID=859192 RepID=S2E615_9ARCH|nr:Hachiman antiphage defense system protein HamA [Candidatus Nitrosarchaeum limnium]EPA06178.1 hypothetical protein BG20_I0833 [Candidatus Nitrosarchaeum limnium BG20]